MAVTFDLGNVNRQLLSDSVHHRSLPQAIGDHRTIRSHNVQTTAAAADRTGKGLPEVQKNYYHNRPSSAAAAVQLQREPKPTHQYGAGSAVSASYLPSPDWTPIAAATPPPLQLKKKLQDAASGNDDVNYPLHRHPDFVTFVTPPPPPSTPMPPTPLQQTAVRENRGNKDLHHLQNDYSTQNNDDGRGTKDNYAVHRGGYNNDNRLQYVVINTAAVGDGGAAEAKKPSYDANDYAHPRQTSYVAGDANPSSDDASSKVQVQFGYVNDEQLETTVAGERHGSRPHGNYMSAAAAVVGEQTAVQLQQPRENYGGVLRQSSSNNLRVDTALNLPEYVQAGADEALTAEGEVLTAAEEGRWDAYVDGNVADPKFDGDAKKGDTGVGDGHATADDGTAVVVRATGWPDDEVAVDDNNDRTPGTDAVDKSKRRGASGGKDTRKGATGGRRIRPYHSNGRTAATAPDNDYGSARAQSDRVHQLDRDEEIGGSRGSSAVAAVVTKSSAVLRQRRRKVQSSPAPSGGLKRRTRPTQVAAVMHREHGDDDYGGLHRSTTTDHGQNGSDELNVSIIIYYVLLREMLNVIHLVY